MAAGHVRDRWWKSEVRSGKVVRVKTDEYGQGKRYKVEYPTPTGRPKYKSFPDGRKEEAYDFLLEMQDAVKSGKYIDPKAAQKPFGPFALNFVKTRAVDESTRETMERHLRNHMLPTWEDELFGQILPSGIRDWDAALEAKGLEPATREVIFAHMKAICNAAVDDGIIQKNPCCAKSVVAPKAKERQVVPWTHGNVKNVRQKLRARYRALVDVGAGAGLRSGELFGFSLDDVSEDESEIAVVRQVKMVRSRPCFGLPKNDRPRTVPLPSSTLKALRAHIEEFPPVSITLPWEKPGGDPVTVSLLFTTAHKNVIRRTDFMPGLWKPAREAAGIKGDNHSGGMHALRHHYASVLLEAGVSIKALSAYLGHHDPGYTLRTYTHLMPSSGGKAASAIDALWAA